MRRSTQTVIVSVCLLLSVLTASPGLPAQTMDLRTEREAMAVERLSVLQSQIDSSVAERDAKRATQKTADISTQTELQREIDALNAEIDRRRQSFEQIAIGSVDMDVFGATEMAFDWRSEVTEILQPIVENLKALTDKPRKIGRLQTLIEHTELQAETIDGALQSIATKQAAATDPAVSASLANLRTVWERNRDDNQQQLEVARLQLAELSYSDTSWWEVLRQSSAEFFRGRGLTLLIAISGAALVWLLMHGAVRLFQLRLRTTNNQGYQTRRRLAQYAYRGLTLLLILIVVIAVFNLRGDMLLMGLSIIAAAGVALGLRQAIPRFIAEARLLLNLGSIRDQERVLYNGLPWKVVSLNMFTVLRNPELAGVVRLPLKDLADMNSRPMSNEPWFPSRAGDFIVLDGERLREVVRQTTESIELVDRGGTLTTVPTVEYYGWTFRNLSRNETFGVSSVFGIDYRHQAISLDIVPTRLKSAIVDTLQQSTEAHHLVDVAVELQSAGSSSLDYWIHVTMHRAAAKAYNKLQRLIQQSCIAVCTAEKWEIPYPHVTIKRFEPSEQTAAEGESLA